LAKKVNEVLEMQKGVKRMGVEDGCTAATLKGIRKALSVRVKPVSNVVEKVRAIKGEGEIRLIGKASKIAFDAMDWALGQMKPGITERELAALYVYRSHVHLGRRRGSRRSCVFGPNGSRHLHQPADESWAKNDMVLLDFGANYEGYIIDTTRSFAVGRPSDFTAGCISGGLVSQKAAIASIRPGVKGCEVDAAARKAIADAGLPVYGHGTGHGVGLQVHELPFKSALDKMTTLEAGQVIHSYPGFICRQVRGHASGG
jgi:Xaa-Pro aminopeptidase